MKGKGKLLKIYIGESDKYNGKTLYPAVLKDIKSEGLAGATIVRGIEVFGATSKIENTRNDPSGSDTGRPKDGKKSEQVADDL